ncbi:MAG: A24 family peptidase C-terminal domain-containing protein [Methanothermobacter sp.]|jgi:preflagellin peptidase FlaK|nr:A24 family peptidase C-terminal domain-containing protein [Methanothermobacter sp.]HOQ19747.1 A24 family peptidase C-terminal domain-containing protein [Methanothermobacter sp.]
MSITLLSVVIALIATLYAAYSDIKTGIIPNRLTIPLIVVGIILNGVKSLQVKDPQIIIYALILTVTIFILGYILWRAGAWAGGDVKLFTGLAALLPFQPYILRYSILGVPFPIIAPYPFPFTLIVNSILAMLPFLIVFIFYTSYKCKRHLFEELLEPLKNYKSSLLMALVVASSITLTLSIMPFIPLRGLILYAIIIYIFTIVISKLPNLLKAPVVGVITAYSFYRNPQLTLTGIIILWLSMIILQVGKRVLGRQGREALQDNLKVEQLEEGMILAYGLYEKGGKYYFDDKSLLEKFKETIKSGNLDHFRPGRPILTSMAAGLTAADIKFIREVVDKGEIPNHIKIRKGVPFAPAISIGFILALLIGDIAMIFSKILNLL